MTFNLITRLKTTDEFKFIGGTGMIALIAAFAQNQVIGNKGCIPWKIKGEQKRFRELTTGM